MPFQDTLIRLPAPSPAGGRRDPNPSPLPLAETSRHLSRLRGTSPLTLAGEVAPKARVREHLECLSKTPSSACRHLLPQAGEGIQTHHLSRLPKRHVTNVTSPLTL